MMPEQAAPERQMSPSVLGADAFEMKAGEGVGS